MLQCAEIRKKLKKLKGRLGLAAFPRCIGEACASVTPLVDIVFRVFKHLVQACSVSWKIEMSLRVV
jgi:hypothetical protein